MLKQSQGRLPIIQRFTITFKNEFIVQKHMVNLPNCGSIGDFPCKLTSDLINKIFNDFGVFQGFNVKLKKVGSSKFVSRKY